jgi:glycosyltransferase involved in cell wall biosynthesis
MVLLEAADAEVPIAAFDVGGVAEVLTDPRVTRLVPPGDVRGLALALIALAEDPAADLSASAWRQAVSLRFSLDRIVASYSELYRSLRR